MITWLTLLVWKMGQLRQRSQGQPRSLDKCLLNLQELWKVFACLFPSLKIPFLQWYWYGSRATDGDEDLLHILTFCLCGFLETYLAIETQSPKMILKQLINTFLVCYAFFFRNHNGIFTERSVSMVIYAMLHHSVMSDSLWPLGL